MILRRRVLFQVAVLMGLAGNILPESGFADGLRYLAFGYVSIDLVLQARAGILRRRPHWTADSWRLYLKACSVPIGAFAIMVLMMAALEWRLPMVGAARSSVRAVWAGGTLAFMVIGTVGLVFALDWLNRGDPAWQFESPRWLSFGRRKAA